MLDQQYDTFHNGSWVHLTINGACGPFARTGLGSLPPRACSGGNPSMTAPQPSLKSLLQKGTSAPWDLSFSELSSWAPEVRGMHKRRAPCYMVVSEFLTGRWDTASGQEDCGFAGAELGHCRNHLPTWEWPCWPRTCLPALQWISWSPTVVFLGWYFGSSLAIRT